MLGSVKWIAMGIAASVAALVLSVAGSALADEAAAPSPVRLAFEEPQAVEGGVSVSVLLTTAAGEPISRQQVDFFVTPDFFGERPMLLRTAITDTKGKATITYVPTWDGGHRLTADFAGNEANQAAEATAMMTVSGLPAVVLVEPGALDALRRWAAPGAVAVAMGVWLLLAWVLFRVGWGISRAGRRSQ